MFRFTPFVFKIPRHNPNEAVIRNRPRFDTLPKTRYSQHPQKKALQKRSHWKYGSGMNLYFPGQQIQQARRQHVSRVSEQLKITESESYRRNYTMTQLMRDANARFGETADDHMVRKGTYNAMQRAHELKRLQGLGDDEPLSTDPDLGFTKLDIATHGRRGVFERIEGPIPFNKRLSRRMAEGRLWPTVHGTADPALVEPAKMKHAENMSPSEQKFSAEVEYWLRRNLRAAPAHIGDQIDWTEMIIERCFVSRRCKELFIVWSTVSGPARLAIEPVLVHLNPWVIRTIKSRMKHVPNIPRVQWVYDSGAIPTEMPNKLARKLQTVLTNHSTTIEQRVDYLKQLDTLEHRMRGIPWFMPYLWAKEQKVSQSGQMRRDFVAMKDQQKQQKTGNEGFSGNPSYVS